MPVCALIAMLVLAASAVPATAADGASGIPQELWNSLPAEPAGHETSSGGVALMMVLGTLAIASVGGFLVGELMPVRRARAGPPRIVRRATPRGPRLVGCTIALTQSGTRAEFEAVAGRGADRAVIGRSPSFAMPRSGSVPDEGPARAAYDVLMAQLQANGWQSVGAEPSVWYHAQLVRE